METQVCVCVRACVLSDFFLTLNSFLFLVFSMSLLYPFPSLLCVSMGHLGPSVSSLLVRLLGPSRPPGWLQCPVSCGHMQANGADSYLKGMTGPSGSAPAVTVEMEPMRATVGGQYPSQPRSPGSCDHMRSSAGTGLNHFFSSISENHPYLPGSYRASAMAGPEGRSLLRPRQGRRT